MSRRYDYFCRILKALSSNNFSNCSRSRVALNGRPPYQDAPGQKRGVAAGSRRPSRSLRLRLRERQFVGLANVPPISVEWRRRQQEVWSQFASRFGIVRSDRVTPSLHGQRRAAPTGRHCVRVLDRERAGILGPLRRRVGGHCHRSVSVFPRAQAIESSVRMVLIVVPPKRVDLLMCVLPRREPMHVQTFLPKAPVEGFERGVVRRLARRGSSNERRERCDLAGEGGCGKLTVHLRRD